MQLFRSWKQKSPLIATKFRWQNQLNLLVIFQVYGHFLNIFTKKREVPECFLGRFSLLFFYSLVQKENIGLEIK